MLTNAIIVGAVVGALAAAQPRSEPPAPDDPASILGFTVTRLDGTPQPLADYEGKVVVIVNVASKCGYTPQYEALQKLYEAKKDRGLVILGFPANNFGAQEPGSNKDIATFCAERYGVTFPMFEKISVKGPDQHPLYKRLAAQPAPVGGDPKWNFTKFVIDRSGRIVARFDAKTRPGLEPDLLKMIDGLLGPAAGAPDAPPSTPNATN